MSEHEPTIRFYLTGEMRQSDFTDLVSAVGNRMLEGVRFGQGELDFSAGMEREELARNVTIQAARNFYLHLFQDDKPSPIATVVMRELAREVPDSQKIKNKKNELAGITRGAWDTEAAKILNGESKIKYRPGTKKREFLEAFNAYLPAAEPQKKPKKGKH
jgi:hypothetical protein